MAQATISGNFSAAYQSSYSKSSNGTAGDTRNKGFTQPDAVVRFSVAEDLGSGLKLSGFVQIAGGSTRTKEVAKEDSALSLAGGFGTVTFTNTRSSNTAIRANVFASWMPVTSFYAGVHSRAAGDSFGYTSPEIMPGLRVGVSTFETTEGSGTSAGKVTVLSANYAQGPLNVAFANKRNNDAIVAATAGTEKTTNEIAATYNFGVARVGLGYSTKRTATDDNLTSYGVSVPMGAFTFGVNGAKRGDVKFYDAGVNYSLSKRTTLSVMTGKLTGGDNTGKQMRVGVNHTF